MKELFKIISRKILLISFIVNLIYSIADYGTSFALGHFGTSPLLFDKIVKLTFWILIIDIIKLVFCKLGSYIDNINSIRMENDIQKYYFKKMQNISFDNIINTHTGYIYNLISNLSYDFSGIIFQIQISIVPLVIGGTAILFVICKQSIITGVICILISILAVFLKYKLIKRKQKCEAKVNDLDGKYSATYIDFMQNIITVRKLNLLNFCKNKIDEDSKKLLNAVKENEKKKTNANTVFTILMNLLYLVVFISTIFIVKEGKDGLPYLLFYIAALGKLYFNLNTLVSLLDNYEKFKTTKKQLDEYFKNSRNMKIIKDYKSIKIKNGIFSYKEESEKIKIPEFILNKGDKISIIGESGQGKTTILNILAGLYSLKEGQIYLDDNQIKDSTIDLVFVSQEIELFNLSLRDNLTLGNDIEDFKIISLLEEIGLKEWFDNLPEKLDTIIGERGIKISSGQKQRLNIVRGILRNKQLYFFDEPTSNLDSNSERKVIDIIDKYLKNKTYIIVTHRPNLEKLCNRHYVFKNHMINEIIKA